MKIGKVIFLLASILFVVNCKKENKEMQPQPVSGGNNGANYVGTYSGVAYTTTYLCVGSTPTCGPVDTTSFRSNVSWKVTLNSAHGSDILIDSAIRYQAYNVNSNGWSVPSDKAPHDTGDFQAFFRNDSLIWHFYTGTTSPQPNSYALVNYHFAGKRK